MTISDLKADNFKSLVHFSMPMEPFVCLIGLNGSGKSTILQFLDFLSHLHHGDVTHWLQSRNWARGDLNSRLNSRQNIDFSVDLKDDAGQELTWNGSFNRNELRCTRERIERAGELRLHVESGTYSIPEPGHGAQGRRIEFQYEGSILSQLKESQLPEDLRKIHSFFTSFHALDMLSPESMRQRTRESAGSLGLGGERLSAFLHEIGAKGRRELVAKLGTAYPHLEGMDVKSLRSGWKQLLIKESFGGRSLPTEARHMSDGLLRMIAVFAQLSVSQSMLLLDEVENGINPELVEFVIDALVAAQPQVIVTTHSPLVLNYIDDETARQSVLYVNKSDFGATEVVPFFDIPSMAHKLSVMGPGEAYEDTDLFELSDEIATI